MCNRDPTAKKIMVFNVQIVSEVQPPLESSQMKLHFVQGSMESRHSGPQSAHPHPIIVPSSVLGMQDAQKIIPPVFSDGLVASLKPYNSAPTLSPKMFKICSKSFSVDFVLFPSK